MKPPAIIAVDIDGTLLAPDGDVLPTTRAEFARARAAGATIVLASGRPIAGLRTLVDRLKLDTDGMVLSGANGSMSVDAVTGDVIARHAMPHEVAHRILRFVADQDVVTMLSDGDAIVVETSDEQIVIEAEGNGLRVREVDDLCSLTADDVTVDKILLYAPADTLQGVATAFVAEFGDDVETAFSAPFYFEATAKGVDKASALRDVAAHRGLDATDSVAFGDNGNDLPMLRLAGMGVAMGNAIPEVLEVADRVTEANDADGIALVLADLYGEGTPAPPVARPEGIAPLKALDVSAGSLDEARGDDDPDSTRGDAV